MAETKNTTEKRVDVHIPRGAANDDPNYYVSVNGENFILPKGKTSSVPEYVAREIERANRAQARLDEKVDELLEASK